MKKTIIDLTKIDTKNGVAATYADGIMFLTNEKTNRGNAFTKKAPFAVPIKIVMRIKLSEPRFDIFLANGSISFHGNELHIKDIKNKHVRVFENVGDLPLNEFFDLEWILEADFMAVCVNGETWVCDTHTAYMDELKRNPGYYFLSDISISCFKDAPIEVQSIVYYENSKQRIEDILPKYFGGEMMETVMNFIAFLQQHKMKLKWGVENGWQALYAKSTIVWVKLGVDKWSITVCLPTINDYQDFILSEGWQDFIWNKLKLRYCWECNPNRSCLGGRSGTLLGKSFERVCAVTFPLRKYYKYGHGVNLVYTNPDDAAIERIKKLLQLEQKARDN